MHLKRGSEGRLDDVENMSYSAREVHFDAEDADIVGTGTLSLCLEDRGGSGGGRRGLNGHCGVWGGGRTEEVDEARPFIK